MAKKHSNEEAPGSGEQSPEALGFKEFISAEIETVETARDEYVAACEAKLEGEAPTDAAEVISVTTKLDRAFEEFKTFALAKMAEDGDEEEKKRQVIEKKSAAMSDIKQHGKSLDREETSMVTEEVDKSTPEVDLPTQAADEGVAEETGTVEDGEPIPDVPAGYEAKPADNPEVVEEVVSAPAVEESSAEVAEEDQEHEPFIGEVFTVDKFLVFSPGDVIGSEILVKEGATLRVYGELRDSVIRIEPGGNYEFKGADEGHEEIKSDIIWDYVEPAVEPEPTPAAESDKEGAAPAEASGPIPDVPAGHEAKPIGGETEEPTPAAEEAVKPTILDNPEGVEEEPGNIETPDTGSEAVKTFTQEDLEKQLGYLDIHPAEIFQSLEAGELKVLHELMTEHGAVAKEVTDAAKNVEAVKNQPEDKQKAAQEALVAAEQKLADANEKVINFYKHKIKEILENTKNQELLSEDDLRKVAERINEVIQQTIDAAAQQEIARLNMKKVKSLALRTAIDAALITAGSIGITALTGGIGGLASVGISSSAVSGIRLLIRKIRSGKEKKKQEENRLKEQAEIEEKKTEVLNKLFADVEIFSRQLSGHISNTIREQTSGTALETLRISAEEARDKGHGQVMDSTLGKMEKELYQSALVQIEANYPASEYPGISALQRHNMAVQLAMTLGQHERGELEAKKRMEELKGKNPAVYGLIKKYNLLSAGKPDKIPDDATEAEKTLWEKHKYDVYSLLVGTAVGMAVRMEGTTRVALGALGGAGMGHMIAEDRGRRGEQKAMEEIAEMLTEAEMYISDISFPVDKLEKLRAGSIQVQSKLELGILDGNPLLKSRAENFIHNVRKIEMQNQELLDGLMAQMTANADTLEKVVETDLSRIEKHTKRRKVLFIAGGAIVGGAAAFFGADLLSKLKGDDASENVPERTAAVSGEEQVDSSAGKYDGTSAWKSDETDPWKTGGGSQIDTPDGTGSPEPPGGAPEPVPTPEKITHFEDTVDSSKVVGGSDSIWRSTRTIFTENAKALGYDGDPADTEALSKWAESQTAAVVNKLNIAQGGNLADLVHDGDVVKVDLVDGKPVLSFAADSGEKVGHLSDTNVEKFFSDTKFEEGMEAKPEIDPSTGDQFVTLKTEDGIIKIYDWDRDGNPNVVMPDGAHKEMTPAELKTFMEQQNVSMTAEEVTAQDARLAELVRIEETKVSINEFLEGKGTYSHEMYSVAKIEGNLDDVLHKLLSDNNPEQIEQFVGDYFKDYNMGDDKRFVFLHEIAKLYGTDELKNYEGNMESLLTAFDKNVTTSFEQLDAAFDSVKGDKEWVPTKVDGKYALIRHEARFMRKDLFYIDTNGDGMPDAIKDADAMKEVFEGKQPLVKEHIKLDDGGKTFSLKRPAVDAKESELRVPKVEPQPLPTDSKVPEVNQPDVLEATIPDLSADTTPRTVEVGVPPVSEIPDAELPKEVKVNINPDATKVMVERGIEFKGGNLEVRGMGPIVFSKEAADAAGIELPAGEVGVTDSVDINLRGGNLEVKVTDQDGSTDMLIIDKDNKLVEITPKDPAVDESVQSETPAVPETQIPEQVAEVPMDSIDYAIGTLNAGGKDLDFKLEKINDYDLDYLKKIKAFTEAQIVAIGEDSKNPRAIALREGMKIIDKEVDIRIRGFENPSV